ncbi:Transposase InsO and inactivated derivatives [Halanaerobium congolense]|uniref:Transposase InsO and inactivated derivatives n=1 Tax=Halanaerobium congolense TaxID=54121 RepID=A0A1G6MSB2_9FIRM|nr:Transposase InsO and inactivated derivatives [Halanaerobium congolense]
MAGDGFLYSYRKLTVCLKEDYNLKTNKKKVYRLCKELDILRPQTKIKKIQPKKIAKQEEITEPNQLLQMDLKYGYIDGTDQFFFQMSVIDVFDKIVIGYHLGLSCKAKNTCRVLKAALNKIKLYKGMNLPKTRTDNGPQFVSRLFGDTCESLGLEHQRIPVRTPNMNAYIESFHSVLGKACYSINEFSSFSDAYKKVSEYMNYYNNRYCHVSLNDMPPEKFYELAKSEKIVAEPVLA